jgi:hypothetical protein
MKQLLAMGAGFTLLLIMTNISLAGTWDFNPGQEAVKHKNDVTSDVAGQGYFMEYTRVNTNNLSMLEYSHGSGKLDFADILYDEQKTIHTSGYIYYIDYSTGDWTRKRPGASSAITYTRQYDNVQSPATFAYGTGFYAAHPVTYNSLLKDRNEAKSYQEAASMDRQIEYARAVKGDISVDMNCTAPTATVSGKGSISMKTDDDVTEGTLHIGELVFDPKLLSYKFTGKQTNYGHNKWEDPIIEIDKNYIGDFKVQKTMKLDVSKSAPTWAEDWLPCCSGGFFDVPSYNFDKEHASQKGIFDCTCRNTSISTMRPAWNASLAQFPTDKYRYKP